MGDGGGGNVPEKQPNDALRSWFARSGWSKGELARQVNRRARQLGAHHISTDTSRVRRWLDGEQPREPIPRILSELFSERFGCVVGAEDVGLRAARSSPPASGVDLPWAGPQTVAMISEFSRSDLMLGRRGFLGPSLSMAAGQKLIEPMQRWLVPAAMPGGSAEPGPGPLAGAAPSAGLASIGHLGREGRVDGAERPGPDRRPPGEGEGMGRMTQLSEPELELLEQTTVMFRRWDAQCGGGLRRKAVVGQLHEVTDLLRECRSPVHRRRLFGVTGELAELAGWMSYDVGMQPTAQKYFVLALHAAKEAEDRPLGAYVLSNMSRQMIHLGRPEDALELTHLAQYGSREGATARTQAMLHALEARAYANMGQPGKCKRAVRMAEETFEDIDERDADPDWMRFFSAAELHAENAHSYRDLAYSAGRSPAYASLAEPAMARAVELFRQEAEETEGGGHQRSFALNLIGMASVHLLRHEPERCASRAAEALDVARRLRSEQVNNRLRSTAATAARDFGEVPAVARLSRQLAGEPPDGELAVA
ncbi:NsdA [Streptomyces oceani]|uniref:NsdA n=1 Tax=Streptomyces oceani TaxID=1075402 RepID=A0A1E7JRM2_9ACTN|nr:NsdA [Streptomyces oceani]